MQKQAALLALAASAGLASAQFTVLVPAASPSDGASFTETYTGTSTIFSTLSFTGDLTEVNTATWAGEANWDITNNSFGSTVSFDPFGTDQDFTGTVSANVTASGLFWANNGDQFQFDSFETFDDGSDGVADAQWDNASFEFSGGVSATNLGNLGSNVTFDTNGSGADTEIAVYTLDGILVDTNDDNGGGGLWSLLNLSLADGSYLLVVGTFNASFGDGAAIGGAGSGSSVLNVNGNTVASGQLASGQLDVYSFTIPAPGSAALLGLGGLAAIRRRR
ncbi:MAG: hypothetical protein RIB60_00580 [Phycisphaerales bacterium]